MSEEHLGMVAASFACGPECPTCRAIVTPAEVMEEHMPMCAALANERAKLAIAIGELQREAGAHDNPRDSMAGKALARINELEKQS